MRTGPASISRYDECKLACETYTLALSAVNLQSAFRKTGIYPVDRNVIISFSVLPAEVVQSRITNEGNNINGVNSDVVIHIDESCYACLNASTCTSSGGHDNIDLSQQSDTLGNVNLHINLFVTVPVKSHQVKPLLKVLYSKNLLITFQRVVLHLRVKMQRNL